MGQVSCALSQTVITKSKRSLTNCSTDLDLWCEISMSTSRIASTASGRTLDGFTPALSTSNLSPATFRKRPSAIWLRAEFPVHKIRTRFLLRILFRYHPIEKIRRCEAARHLNPYECGCVYWPDARECVAQRASDRNGRIGE